MASTPATPAQPPAATAWVPVSLAFVNAKTGWLLAIPDQCTRLLHGAPACPPRVEITQDGGSHWRVVASPAFPASTARVVFADSHDGWVFGDQLWATHDGGRTWRHLPVDGPVRALAATSGANPTVLAVAGCPDPPSCPSSGPPRLLRAAAGSNTFTPTSVVLPRVGDYSVTASGTHLVFLSIAKIDAGGTVTAKLYRSTDAGAHLAEVADPCNPDRTWTQHVSADLAGGLWLTCGTQPASGALQEHKALFRSTNAAQTWSTPIPLPAGGSGPVVAAVSPHLAVLTLTRNPLWISRDGGHHWRTVLADNADAGFSGAWVTPMFGWFLTARIIWRTSDAAAHWTHQRWAPG